MEHTGVLKGRVALVTGGASGLGRATATTLAAAGAHVVVADVDAAGSEETRSRIADAGGSADVVALDVTDDGNRRAVIAQLFDRHGDAFDVLVNVAGIDRPGYVTDIDLADYRQVQAVNCEGPIFLTSEFMKRVQHLPDGRTADVVHIVSLSAITSGSGAIAYNGSKAGFLNATKCIQRELREKAVRQPDGSERPFPCRVQAVIPAAMDTPMMAQWGIPAHLMMPPSAVAEMVRTLLLLHPSSFVPEMQRPPAASRTATVSTPWGDHCASGSATASDTGALPLRRRSSQAVRTGSVAAATMRAVTLTSRRTVGASRRPSCSARTQRPGTPKVSSSSSPTAYQPSSASSAHRSAASPRPSRYARGVSRGTRCSSSADANERSSCCSAVSSRSISGSLEVRGCARR